MANTKILNFSELLLNAKSIDPQFSVAFTYLDEDKFFNPDYQMIQLDHHDISLANEIICDLTTKLVEKRVFEIEGTKVSLITEYSRLSFASMNLRTKKIDITNFERENFNTDDSFSSTLITLDGRIKLVDEESFINNLIYNPKLNQTTWESDGFEIENFRKDVQPNALETEKILNNLFENWLQQPENSKIMLNRLNKGVELIGQGVI